MAVKEFSDSELLKIVDDAWVEACEITNSADGWKEVKRNDHGDVVVTKKNKRGKKIYRVTAKINISASKLVEQLQDTEKMCQWNTTLTEHRILRKIGEKAFISYQVTAEGGGGIVSARDFVFLFKGDYNGPSYVQGGCSIDYPAEPKSSKIVRAWNGPGAQTITPWVGEEEESCKFVWLMDCEYRGWIPASILELAMPVAQLQFVDCIRKLAQNIKDGKI